MTGDYVTANPRNGVGVLYHYYTIANKIPS